MDLLVECRACGKMKQPGVFCECIPHWIINRWSDYMSQKIKEMPSSYYEHFGIERNSDCEV